MSDVAASTQTTIILVTDLVGSTERRAEVGEDAAEELRRQHDQLLTDAVAHHRGEVVKGLGDGVLARFHGAADAVAAAVAIQQAAVADRFDVRVGVSAGDVTIEDGDCFGTPVIEASRLCAEAAGGQILVAQLVQLLARGRGGHDFTPVGELELKGLPDPVAASEVAWETVAGPAETGGRVPLQPALAVEDRFPYTGRVVERQALETAWKRATEGERRMVLLSGEPGMGKTRLASEVARSVYDDDATVLIGRADEDLAAPYRPLAEALRHLVNHAPTQVLEAHCAERGDTLLRIVPELSRRVPGVPHAVPSDDERVALFDAALDLLGRVSADTPVLLVLDDLHWADHPTLLFLRHLARSAPAMALLVVATYRDTDLARDHPLAGVLADLRREPSVERVAVAGLDDGEVAALMERTAGHDLDEPALALARAIHDETGGNPFFIGEVLLHLAESGVIYERDGRWSADNESVISHVPDGVREVIGRRLSALGAEADKALRTAAAVGAEFDIDVLADVLEADVDDLIDVLEEPLARRLIEEAPGSIGRFRFAHALVRQSLYEELSALRRSRLHVRILDTLERVGRTDATLLAHHACEAAASGGAAKAVSLAAAAAEEAAGQLALEEAIRWYERALEAEEAIDTVDPARRSQLLIELGRAKNAIGHISEAIPDFAEAAELARQAGDVDLLCAAARDYAMGAGAWVDPDDEVGPALVDEALDRLPEGDSVHRARLLLTKAFWNVLVDDEAQRRLTGEALAIARRVGDPETLDATLSARANAVLTVPDLAELQAVVDEMWATMTDETPTRYRLGAHMYRAVAAMRRGDFPAAARGALEFAEDGARYRSPFLRFRALTVAGSLDLLEGRVDEAREKLAAAEAMEMGAGEGWTTVTGTFGYMISTVADTPEEAADAFRRVTTAAPAFFRVFPDPEVEVVVRGPHPEEAREPMRAWAEEVFPRLPQAYRPPGFHFLSISWRALDVDVAIRAHDEMLAREGQWLVMYPEHVYGAVDFHLARFSRAAGRHGAAIERYERALVEHTRAGEVPWRGHIACELASALLERGAPGDAERARVLAAEALHTAKRVGLRGLIPDAEALVCSEKRSTSH